MPTAVELLASMLDLVESEARTEAHYDRLGSLLSTTLPELGSAVMEAGAAERDALLRFIDQTASRLAALSGRLAHSLGPDLCRPSILPGRLAMARCLAACALVAVCVAAPGRAMTPLFSCAALALGPGTLMLQQIAAGVELPQLLIAWSLDLVPRMLFNLMDSAGAHGATRALAEELPPQQLLAFLRAMTDAASVLGGPLIRSGAAPHLGRMQSSIVADIISVGSYPAQAAALQRDASLRWALVHASLLPALRSQAVAARLPPDRQLESFHWVFVCNVATALASGTIALPELLQERLPAAPEAGSVLTQLLRSTAALLEQLPAERPESVSTDITYYEMLCSLVHLLGLAVDMLPAGDHEARRQAAEHTLPAVRRLPTLLQLPGIGSLSSGNASAMCKALMWIAISLGRACRTSRGDSSAVLSLQDLPAWCAAAVAMLRALPPALNLGARAAEEYPNPYASQLPYALLMVAGDVATACQECTDAVCGLSTTTLHGTHLALDAAAAVAAADALWSLHTACCRLAHCTAVRNQVVAMPGQELACTMAAGLLTHCVGAVVDLRMCLEAAAQRPEVDQVRRVALLESHIPAIDRRLAAMGAAHGEALLALAGGPHADRLQLDADGCIATLRQLLRACMYADAAPLALSEPLQLLVGGLLEGHALHMQQAGPQSEQPVVMTCEGCPLLVAFLAARGLLEVDARCALRLLAQPLDVQTQHGLHSLGEGYAGGLLKMLDSLSDSASAALEAAPTPELRQALQAFAAVHSRVQNQEQPPAYFVITIMQELLAPARSLAAALWAWHQQPEQLAAHRLALARAAAARSCAYLRCANLAGEGGPAAGQGAQPSKCSVCRMAWYCNETCSHADWRGAHKRCCRMLGAERAAAKAAAAAARQQQVAGASSS